MNSFLRVLGACLLLGSIVGPASADQERPLVVGSKNFTEGYLLAEVMTQVLEDAGFEVRRQVGFGGTLIAFEAIVNAEIDVYPEYTGTLSEVILAGKSAGELSELNQALAAHQVEALAPLGFNNTYAVVTRRTTAHGLELNSISDLREHTALKLAFSHEFLNRQDGWPALAKQYGLTGKVIGIEHGLAYQALAEETIDVTDAYSTDGELERYDLRVLGDDQNFFPQYLAVPLVRTSLPQGAKDALGRLAGRLDDETMRRLNAQVVVENRSFADVAAQFLQSSGLTEAQGTNAGATTLLASIAANTLTHLKLTAIALLLACATGIPAAVAVYRSSGLSSAILYLSGLLQTIPSIALLALMIPLLGVGQLPAVVALFLYSLLPIVRNTITALRTIDPLYKKVAVAMGLTRREQLRHVLFPLSLPHVLAGIKTAAVISIGTATLAAFIGAGGLGEPIVTGLALNNTGLILQGAIPAAILAILTELSFEFLERKLIPAHMMKSAH